MIFAVCVGLCVVHVSPHVGSAEAHCVLHTFYSHLGVEAHAVQSLSNEDGLAVYQARLVRKFG